VLDNASNNDTLVEELPNLINDYKGSATRIRCFAHILNLVVKVNELLMLVLMASYNYKAILSQFSKTNTGTSSEDEINKDNAIFEDLADVSRDEEIDPATEEDGQDSDMIDAAVEHSDETAIQEVVDSMTGDVEDEDSPSGELHCLTREEINLGCFSLTKVSHLDLLPAIHHEPCNSSSISARESSTT
jgi:hypothetical protein